MLEGKDLIVQYGTSNAIKKRRGFIGSNYRSKEGRRERRAKEGTLLQKKSYPSQEDPDVRHSFPSFVNILEKKPVTYGEVGQHNLYVAFGTHRPRLK